MFANNTNGIYISWPSVAVQVVIYSLILVSTLVGNVLVVAVFYRDKTLRTSVNYFIVNMSISDLIVPMISLPVLITITIDKSLLFDKGIVSKGFCRVSWTLWSVSIAVSTLSMTALAADRFRAIIFSMKTALFSRKRCFVIIAAMWISSFTLFAYFATYDYCSDSQFTSEKFKFVLILFSLICSSVVVLTVLYFKIAVYLYRQKNSLHLASEVVRKRAKRNRKIITMLVIVVVLFYVVWIPFYVLQFVSYMYSIVIIPWFADYILISLYPVINPVIYFVFNKKYRQGLKEILSHLCLCNKEIKEHLQQNISLPRENRVDNGGHENQGVGNLQLQEQ